MLVKSASDGVERAEDAHPVLAREAVRRRLTKFRVAVVAGEVRPLRSETLVLGIERRDLCFRRRTTELPAIMRQSGRFSPERLGSTATTNWTT